ncbi:hypothetical protein D3H55_10335 [Bacillus salacetis]|uniref:Multi-TM2 domain-containing protein n=1 Tax=Bacillus salacetis TaxID=2315464 RepID=A0A3A1R019_9BACI|nr:hypothetical protein [Bacillus salacetis]RIW33988.1 hypothetical protein D3H55_10335 [Bacillus salacetis]
MKKNPLIAFLLAFFPGVGLLYLGKVLRGLFYAGSVIGAAVLTLFLATSYYSVSGFEFVPLLGGLLIYFVNLIDTAITASKLYKRADGGIEQKAAPESERFFTIILSLVPGLGHFQLGLMNRGVTLLAAFLGMAVMVIFVTVLSSRGEFLVFLAFLPVLWVYSFFDSMQQLAKKQRGEALVDQSILEEFESRREEGKKSKSLATMLSIFPGAGHLYLGYQRRGIQLMAAFLFSIYIMDVMRLGIFLFLVPIIWFYSFFDGLQKASRYGREPVEDVPVISYLVNHQKWVGIGLVALGVYYLLTNIALPALQPIIYEYMKVDAYFWFERYVQTAIVCILLIGGGIKLLTGSKKKGEASQ